MRADKAEILESELHTETNKDNKGLLVSLWKWYEEDEFRHGFFEAFFMRRRVYIDIKWKNDRFRTLPLPF